jgi:hypothetical protein
VFRAEEDALHTAAANFCHGHVVGAYHYYRAMTSRPDRKPLFCLPNPQPSRDEAIRAFVAWAQTHPPYNNEPAVETFSSSRPKHGHVIPDPEGTRI